jgi:hypothetical protein
LPISTIQTENPTVNEGEHHEDQSQSPRSRSRYLGTGGDRFSDERFGVRGCVAGDIKYVIAGQRRQPQGRLLRGAAFFISDLRCRQQQILEHLSGRCMNKLGRG